MPTLPKGDRREPGKGAMKRVLLTGSRGWTDSVTVVRALNQVNTEMGPFTLVHGGCPEGADSIAARWVSRYDHRQEEVHRADWSRGARGGPERNLRMVDSGVDLCLAFILNDSPGATQCLNSAILAGVPYRLWELKFYEHPQKPIDETKLKGYVVE